jgi:hypothetical protein
MLLADQLVVGESVKINSDMIDEIRQSRVIVGLFMARLTVKESPSKVTRDSPIDENSVAARRAAVASPYNGVQGGLILVKT